MRIVLSIVLSLMIFSLGCGGNQTSTVATAAAAVIPLNGNYGFSAVVPPHTSSIGGMGGPLSTDSSGNVTGQFHIVDVATLNALPQPCFVPADVFTVTGKTDAQGVVTLTATSPDGNIITIHGIVSSDSKTISSVTYSVTGTGCDTGDNASLTGFQVQPVSGTYIGQMTIGNMTTADVTLTLSQSATADSNGFFHQTGSMTFQRAVCFTSATIASGEVAGNIDVFQLTADDGSTINWVGVSPDGTTKLVGGLETITGGTGGCDGKTGGLNMVRQ